MELGDSRLTRRERVERIATAERDRRSGHVDLAIAALGEATEWPARAVMALARLPESEAIESRRILEEGLDLWARESGLESLDSATESRVSRETNLEPSTEAFAFEVAEGAFSTESSLDPPIDPSELERAFAEAEAQTDEMHGANDVAERILMDEPIDLPELDGAEAVGRLDRPGFDETESTATLETTDAAEVDEPDEVEDAYASTSGRESARDSALVLATLQRWLQNLEGRQAGRAQ